MRGLRDRRRTADRRGRRRGRARLRRAPRPRRVDRDDGRPHVRPVRRHAGGLLRPARRAHPLDRRARGPSVDGPHRAGRGAVRARLVRRDVRRLTTRASPTLGVCEFCARRGGPRGGPIGVRAPVRLGPADALRGARRRRARRTRGERRRAPPRARPARDVCPRRGGGGGAPAKRSPVSLLRVGFRLSRTGATRIVAPTTRFYLSVDRVRSRGDRRLTGTARSRIGRGGRRRGAVSLRIPAATPTAGYYVLACVDDLRSIRERDERNNCRSSGRAVSIVRPKSLPGAVAAPPATAAPAPAPAAAPAGSAAPAPAPPAGPDADGDGVPDASDCAPADPTIAPGKPDPLDPAFVDSNCDGHDGDIARAVLVSPTGAAAAACGSLATPCLQIDQALANAAALGRHAVYVAGGTYTRFTMVAGVDVIGGFGQNFQRDPDLATDPASAVVTGGLDPVAGEWIGVRAAGIVAPTTLADLEIDGADVPATDPGKSSYGLHVARSTGLTLRGLVVRAGRGAAGAAGGAASDAGAATAAMTGGTGGAAGTTATCDAVTAGAG